LIPGLTPHHASRRIQGHLPHPPQVDQQRVPHAPRRRAPDGGNSRSACHPWQSPISSYGDRLPQLHVHP
jgi:hypothetical protein